MTSSVWALRCASLKLYGAVTGKEGYKNKSFQVRERERESMVLKGGNCSINLVQGNIPKAYFLCLFRSWLLRVSHRGKVIRMDILL